MFSNFKWQIHSSASCFHCFVAFIILYGQKKKKKFSIWGCCPDLSLFWRLNILCQHTYKTFEGFDKENAETFIWSLK